MSGFVVKDGYFSESEGKDDHDYDTDQNQGISKRERSILQRDADSVNDSFKYSDSSMESNSDDFMDLSAKLAVCSDGEDGSSNYSESHINVQIVAKKNRVVVSSDSD